MTGPPWYEEFVIAGLSAVGAICFTNPVDVVKTRMTLQAAGGSSQYPNVLTALWRIGRDEGLTGLQRGLPASCLWQFSNVSVRFGVYGAAKQMTGVDDAESPLAKFVASLGLAGLSGGLAALASNPFFILKTRFQAAQADGGAGQSHAGLAGGLGGAAASIYRTDGMAGFFRGLSAFAPRVIVASAVQLSTYDLVKGALAARVPWLASEERHGRRLPLVVGSSFVTGVAVVGAMQPFDFAATRLVNSRTAAELSAASVHFGPVYTGPLDVIRQTVRAEGIAGVYRGAMANYLRFGPYCVLVFVFVEQGRAVARTLR